MAEYHNAYPPHTDWEKSHVDDVNGTEFGSMKEHEAERVPMRSSVRMNGSEFST